jgi:hypothetical protein
MNTGISYAEGITKWGGGGGGKAAASQRRWGSGGLPQPGLKQQGKGWKLRLPRPFIGEGERGGVGSPTNRCQGVGDLPVQLDHGMAMAPLHRVSSRCPSVGISNLARARNGMGCTVHRSDLLILFSYFPKLT